MGVEGIFTSAALIGMPSFSVLAFLDAKKGLGEKLKNA